MNKPDLTGLGYNPETGHFFRHGKRIGTFDKTSGYVSVHAGGRNHLAHRLAWVLMTGEWPPDEVDHINGNRGDNRWINLRAATRSENARNQYRPTKGIRGANSQPRRLPYKAQIRANGKRIYLGSFATAEEAANAYQAAAEELHGAFAYHHRTQTNEVTS